MSSLSQKLTMFQDDIKKEQNQEALDLLDSMPLSRLKALPIEFGKAKVGQSFEEAFQDQAYLSSSAQGSEQATIWLDQ